MGAHPISGEDMGKLTKDQKRKKKLKERASKQQAQPKGGNKVADTCVDCGEPCYYRDEYIVKDETWAEAGMIGYASGYLHQACRTVVSRWRAVRSMLIS
jgi:hypothetical protein